MIVKTDSFNLSVFTALSEKGIITQASKFYFDHYWKLLLAWRVLIVCWCIQAMIGLEIMTNGDLRGYLNGLNLR